VKADCLHEDKMPTREKYSDIPSVWMLFLTPDITDV